MATAGNEQIIQDLVGAKIKELRQAAGLRAVELAERAEISQSQLSKIERGKATISIKALSRLCQVLDRPLSYLFQSETVAPKMLGTLNTVVGPERQGMIRFSEEVSARTGGRISIIPLKAAQLCPAEDLVEQLRQGVIDLFIESPRYFHNTYEPLQLLAFPYSFDSQEHVKAFLQSDFFENKVRAPLLREGLRLLNRSWNWWRGVEWVLLSKRPIIAPEQIKGLRVRTEELPLVVRFWEEMGARPVPLPWEEVKIALRLGHIDVLPTQKSHLWPLGFCRYARFVTRLGPGNQPLSVAINEAKYQALPPALQQGMIEATEKAGDDFSALVWEAEVENQRRNLAEFQAAYLTVDLAPWREEAARVRERMLAAGELDTEALAELERTRPSAAGGRPGQGEDHA